MKVLLNQEEKELLLYYEKEGWISIKDDEEDQILSIAKHSLQKSKRINIRLSEADLNQLKARAAQEGMPYQTLVSSIIHKYVTGRLK